MAELSWRRSPKARAPRPITALRRRATVGLAVIAAAGLAACSDELGADTTARTAVTAPTLAPASRTLEKVPSRNYDGEPIVIDETGLLACAKNQIASVYLNDGKVDSARAEFAIAAERAKVSSIAKIAAHTAALEAARDGRNQAATAKAVLNTCTSLGFEY